jgi:phytanoyl-CoA hydroxylase
MRQDLASSIATSISDQDWLRFQEQGYLRLGRTVAPASLQALQGRIDDLMLGRLPSAGLMMQLDLGGDYAGMAEQTIGFKGARLDYRKIERLEQDPLFLEYLREPCFRELCERSYGAQHGISIFRAMFMNKPANQGTLLPWHQDGGGIWGLDRDPLLTVWTALDDATIANGCVQVIPGSHRQGLLSDFGHTISPEQAAALCPQERITHLELPAGESVALHNWTLHRSDCNRTGSPRRAFSVCYMDARTRLRSLGTTFPTVFTPYG